MYDTWIIPVCEAGLYWSSRYALMFVSKCWFCSFIHFFFLFCCFFFFLKGIT